MPSVRLREPEALPLASGHEYPAHLRGSVHARMATVWVDGIDDVQAFRKAQDAKLRWLGEQGYVRSDGHVDWRNLSTSSGQLIPAITERLPPVPWVG